MTDHNEIEPQKKHALGIAGGVAKAFITSPISLLLIIAFLVIGMLGLQITPRQEDPQVSVPMVDIFVSYPGASAKEVESQIARPLEGIMSEITGVENVYSMSARGQAMVTVQFTVGEDYNESIVKLHDKLEANKGSMPSGTRGFLVKPKGVDDVPSVTLTLWSNEVDDASLRLVALDVLQSLREVANTSQSFIVDGRYDQLLIEILPERLATYGVSLDQVANTIRMANSERNAGAIEPGNKVVTIVTGSFLKNADDVNRLMVAVVDNRPVYVRDVAVVKEGPNETTRLVTYYTGKASTSEEEAVGAAAVTIAIAKKHGSNGVQVSEAILEKVEALKGHSIPDNINVAVTRDYGASAKEKVNHLLKKLVIATLIVTALVWLFLGWRASTVVLIIIPIVLTTTVFSAWALGLTIDRVSLFALIFSIGILVDDAIVVVENIYRRWLMADSLDIDTAVDAVREVGNPTIIATFTVIAALLPMGFVSGMMGPYMSPIPVLGSVAMLISLFAAFAFTPWLTNKLKPNIDQLRDAAEKEHKQAEMMDRFYRRIIIPMIQKPKKGKLFLYGIIAVFFVSVLLFYPTKLVRVKMLPLDNKPEFNVTVNFPEGTALPITANLINELSSHLKEIEEVTALQTYAGTASPFNFNGLVRHSYLRSRAWQGDIQVQLIDKSDRDRSSHEIADDVRKALTPIAKEAGARIEVIEMPPGPPVLQTIVAEIYGPSAEVRRKFAEDMRLKFEEAENIADVDNFIEAPHDILRFKVDADKAQRNGISVEDINRTLEMAMGGYILGDIKKGKLIDPTPIVMQVPLGVRSDIYRLVQLPVTSKTGVTIPLAELGAFYSEPEDQPIFHKNLRPVEFVTGEGVGKFAAPVYAQFEVQDLLAAENDGKGYKIGETVVTGGHWLGTPKSDEEVSFEWGGEWTVTFETFRDMGIAFMAALVLIYMLIVAQFGNLILPAIVMAPIPLTLIGIVPGHWIMGADFSATSMIGFIALAGIIVRNSILLVDFSREAVMEKGMSVIDAVIHSCEARTRPIAITALALMGGSSVIVSDPIFQGMGVSLIFGGLVSTILTLLVIPLGCISAGDALGACEVDDTDEPSTGGSGATIQPAMETSSSYDDGESLFDKAKEAGGTVAGIAVTVLGFVFTGVKSLLGAGFNLITRNKSKDSGSGVVSKINESHNAQPKAKATVKAKVAPKAKATVKAKVTSKEEETIATKATPKAKAAPKAKAEPKAKAVPKAKTELEATVVPKSHEDKEGDMLVKPKSPSKARRGIRLKDDL